VHTHNTHKTQNEMYTHSKYCTTVMIAAITQASLRHFCGKDKGMPLYRHSGHPQFHCLEAGFPKRGPHHNRMHLDVVSGCPCTPHTRSSGCQTSSNVPAIVCFKRYSSLIVVQHVCVHAMHACVRALVGLCVRACVCERAFVCAYMLSVCVFVCACVCACACGYRRVCE